MFKPRKLLSSEIYGAENEARELKRLGDAINKYKERFGTEDGESVRAFSVPGRAEICGCQTDHNSGKALAASVNLDIIAIVQPIEANKIAIMSEEDGREYGVWLDDLTRREDEKLTPEAIIRGVVYWFREHKLKYGGFKAYFVSNIPFGSGLASSSAFEVMVGTILSYLYGGGRVDPNKIAYAAHYAENIYYGQVCGLTEATTCAHGAFVKLDYKQNYAPVAESIPIDFEESGYKLCVVKTGERADYLDEYKIIRDEMRDVARFFDMDNLRQLVKQDVILNLNELRKKCGDRAALRALYFFDENERVEDMKYALQDKNWSGFLKLANESGDSGFKFLQNAYRPENFLTQEIVIALNLAEYVLCGKGAVRTHGGGFLGAIEAYVPNEIIKLFKFEMERVFGADSCRILSIRKTGACEIVI